MEVAIPAAILIGDHEHPAAARGLGELPSLGGRRRDGLVHDHVKPRVDRREGERDVRAIRSGDHDRVDLRARFPEPLDVGDDADAGMIARRLPLPVAIAGDNRGEGQAWRGRDERGVKRSAAEPIADQRDADRTVRMPNTAACRLAWHAA